MREYKYYIQKIHMATNEVLVLELADIRGLPVFLFKPGQYVMIYYRDGAGRLEQKHAFSIASSPFEKKFIRLGIKVNGKFTKGLLRMKIGDEIFVQGPYGEFVYDENKYADLVMIAGGIGITPFISALNYAADKNLPNKISLIYSGRTQKSMAFYLQIRELEKRNRNIRALFALTDDKRAERDARITSGRLNAEVIKDFIGSVYGKTFFICGPGLFMADIKTHLIGLGADESQIKWESFSMTGSSFWPGLKNITYATTMSAVLFMIAFYAINNSSTTASLSAQKSYDPNSLYTINKAVIDRMASINNAKNKAIADLKQAQLAAENQSSAKTQISQPANALSTSAVKKTNPSSQNAQAPVAPQTQNLTPAVPQPMPRTTVS